MRRLGLHVGAAAGHPDLMILPGREEAAHRVVQLEVAALIEAHQRHGGDRLAHRIDAEDGVVGHRLAALPVHLAERAKVGEVAVPGDRDLAAGDLAGADVVAFQVVGDAFEPGGREAGLLGRQFHDQIPSRGRNHGLGLIFDPRRNHGKRRRSAKFEPRGPHLVVSREEETP
jgi:hypothetical protein